MAQTSRNIFWLSFSRVVAMVLTAIAYFSLFRYLGSFGTGQHQFVLSYNTIFAVIVDFGIQQYIIKKMSEEPEKIKTYFYNFLAVEAVLAFCIYASMLIIAQANSYPAVVQQAIAMAGIGMVVNALTYPFLSVMSVKQDLRKVAFINFLNSLIAVLIIFATVVFKKYIVFLVSNQLIFGISGLILYYHFVKQHFGKIELLKVFSHIDTQLIKQIFKASVPFALLVGFSTVYNKIDIIIIQHSLGFVETGVYAAAYKFFDLMAFFPSVVSFSLYPVFASLMAKKALADVRTHIEEYLRFLIAIAIPMGVGGSLLAVPLMAFLAGPEFSAGAPVLAVIVWATAVLFIYIVANSLVISQLTRFAVIITGANVFINIIGNLILLPRYGIIGAAIMTVVSESLQGLFYFYFIKSKITQFNFLSLFIKPTIASAVMGVVIYYTRDINLSAKLFEQVHGIAQVAINTGWLIALGTLVYGVVLALLGFFRHDDKQFIKNLLRLKTATNE